MKKLGSRDNESKKSGSGEHGWEKTKAFGGGGPFKFSDGAVKIWFRGPGAKGYL